MQKTYGIFYMLVDPTPKNTFKKFNSVLVREGGSKGEKLKCLKMLKIALNAFW